MKGEGARREHGLLAPRGPSLEVAPVVLLALGGLLAALLVEFGDLFLPADWS